MGQSSWGYCKEADAVKYVLLCRAVCGEMFYTEQQSHRDAPERAREQGKQSVLANPDKARRVSKHFKVTDTITARCAFRQWQTMMICTFSVASPQFWWPLCPKNLYVVSASVDSMTPQVGPREYILFDTAQVYPEYIVEFVTRSTEWIPRNVEPSCCSMSQFSQSGCVAEAHLQPSIDS